MVFISSGYDESYDYLRMRKLLENYESYGHKVEISNFYSAMDKGTTASLRYKDCAINFKIKRDEYTRENVAWVYVENSSNNYAENKQVLMDFEKEFREPKKEKEVITINEAALSRTFTISIDGVTITIDRKTVTDLEIIGDLTGKLNISSENKNFSIEIISDEIKEQLRKEIGAGNNE